MTEYEMAVDPGLVEFIEMVRSVPKDEANKLNYKISEIGDKQREGIESITGETLNAKFNVINGSGINHIDNRHGKDGSADHSMANIEDIARIAYVLENYDNVGFLIDKDTQKTVTSDNYKAGSGKHAPILFFVKKVNGFYSIAQAVNDSSKGWLNIISAYKSKNKPT